MHFPHVMSVSARVTTSLLVTLFRNDLEHFLLQHTPGIIVDYTDDDVSVSLKLFILIYADDTVIFCENPEEHQQSLNAFQKYCEIWKVKR